MQTTEFEGKTIDEAIQKACLEYQVPRGKLDIDILSEGTTGFLGIGAKKARIRASLMRFDMTLEDPFAVIPEESTPIAPPKPSPAVPLPAGAMAERARGILEGILERMNMACPITAEEKEEVIVLNIHGDGGGLLIGKRGQNLDALQYIVNKAVNRSENGRKAIIIDTEAYRQRREESLVTLAAKLGDKVKKTHKPVTVSHMNAHDRRIIHLALQEDTSLVTKSRGEGEYRKIVIMPSRKR
jgi:spoIIIJ-associated protein